ncbi:MAG TPA: glutamate racemase [Tepidisphaeraceae bacterium]|nr:glutamate racemase [Tepidisphaeraceae bacterium]
MIDSGLGGLTVVAALRTVLPNERIIYFGDTARLPYGSKSAATVTTFVKQIIAYLRPHGPKHVVIACNTATALALPALRKEFPDLSISGVIEPGARAAAEAAGNRQFPVIGVIATEATVKSRAYEKAIHRRRHHARLLQRPTPLLVPMIEEGRDCRDPVVRLAVAQYIQPLLNRSIEVLLLGCTHYPLLKDLFVELLGPDVRVIDSAQTCAEDVQRRLSSAGLLCGEGGESLRCFVTDDSPRFAQLAAHFLGFPVDSPTWVPPDELYNQPSDTLVSQAD